MLNHFIGLLVGFLRGLSFIQDATIVGLGKQEEHHDQVDCCENCAENEEPSPSFVGNQESCDHGTGLRTSRQEEGEERHSCCEVAFAVHICNHGRPDGFDATSTKASDDSRCKEAVKGFRFDTPDRTCEKKSCRDDDDRSLSKADSRWSPDDVSHT